MMLKAVTGPNFVTPAGHCYTTRAFGGPPLILHAAENPGSCRSKVLGLVVCSSLSFAVYFEGRIRLRLLGYREVFPRPSRFAPKVTSLKPPFSPLSNGYFFVVNGIFWAPQSTKRPCCPTRGPTTSRAFATLL